MTIVAIRPLFIIVTLMALILMVVLHMWTFGAGWSSVLVLFFLMITHFCLVTYDLPGVLMRMYRSEFFSISWQCNQESSETCTNSVPGKIFALFTTLQYESLCFDHIITPANINVKGFSMNCDKTL